MLTSFSRRFKLEAVKRARRSTLTPTDWLDAALKALERGGLDAVRVVALSEALGASRGSFYWHFRDRADLLGRMLEHWEAEITDRVLAATHAAGGSAEERFHVLLEDVLERRRGRYELAIRAWAMHDRKAAATVRRCDRKRLDFVAGLFREIGFSTDESRARAPHPVLPRGRPHRARARSARRPPALPRAAPPPPDVALIRRRQSSG